MGGHSRQTKPHLFINEKCIAQTKHVWKCPFISMGFFLSLSVSLILIFQLYIVCNHQINGNRMHESCGQIDFFIFVTRWTIQGLYLTKRNVCCILFYFFVQGWNVRRYSDDRVCIHGSVWVCEYNNQVPFINGIHLFNVLTVWPGGGEIKSVL